MFGRKQIAWKLRGGKADRGCF